MNFDRRITAFRPDLAAERLRGRVEAERYTTGTLKRLTTSFHSLHRHPSADAPIDTQVLFGEVANVFEEREGWAWVQLQDDGYVGYIPAGSLGDIGTPPTHRIKAVRTFIYPGPNLKLPNQGLLTLNSRVSVTEIEGEYARLGTGGYVMAAHLSDVSEHETDFVAIAERFLHTPYLWGGKTSIGIDCSGLAQISLLAAGIHAPRDSDMQENALGTAVEIRPDLSGLQRGDLVFWKGHVAIMLDETRMIHATGHTMTVSIEPLAVAEERIRTVSYGPITAIKRLSTLGG
ncbi:MAG: peptidase [Microvirga sp.]|jgi:cell wall-associated NlpC family hydrolase|nr:peptidase [Microvirga sp.]